MARVVAAQVEIPLARRDGENRLLSPRGKPLLVIVEGRDIDAMVDAGLEAIGGLRRIVGNQPKVVLKPNTNQRDPFPSITALETLRAVARHCCSAGAQHIVVHEDHKNELDLYYDPKELPGVDIQFSHAPTNAPSNSLSGRLWSSRFDAISRRRPDTRPSYLPSRISAMLSVFAWKKGAEKGDLLREAYPLLPERNLMPGKKR